MTVKTVFYSYSVGGNIICQAESIYICKDLFTIWIRSFITISQLKYVFHSHVSNKITIYTSMLELERYDDN